MKNNLLNLPLLFLVAVSYSTLCFGQTITKPSAKVLIHCNACVGQKAAIKVQDLLSEFSTTLAESRIDASGMASIMVPVTDPLLAFITIGPDTEPEPAFFQRLYLESNQDLKLTIVKGEVLVEGSLGVINQYLSESMLIDKQVVAETNAQRGKFKAMTEEEQKQFKDKFGSQFIPFHQTITNDARISARQRNILIADNQFLVQWRKSYFGGIDLKRFEEGSGYDAPQFMKDIPVDAFYLKANMDMYRRVIDYEIMVNLQGAIYLALKKDGQEKNVDTLALLTEKAILNNKRLTPIREFLLAANLTKYLEDFGLGSQANLNFTRFKEAYPNSTYTQSLESTLGRYYTLEEGKEAPDFTATDIHGNEVRLSDLKGKVVYIDTWATWCAPCIAEFPHSKKMIEHYQDNDDVVFLFVSVDADTKKWKSFVNSDKVPNGMHVNYYPENQKTSLHELYRMSGIPHYILIDKDGKVKMNRAPRPSEKESYSLINGLLNQ